MDKIKDLKDNFEHLRMFNSRDNIDKLLHLAQINKQTYVDFLIDVLDFEIQCREKKLLNRRFSAAHLPAKYNLDEYDFNFSCGITKQQLKELRELIWLGDAYNVILMGPSGTGKTFVAAGLVYEAVKRGLKAYLMTMEEIINIIKLKDASTRARGSYTKLINANLIAIDDIMLFPVNKEEATGFFNLINILHEKTSLIITTNKSPTEWVETLNDEVLTTALLDRILYRCEVIKLSGKSYRIENRKTIFIEK